MKYINRFDTSVKKIKRKKCSFNIGSKSIQNYRQNEINENGSIKKKFIELKISER